VFVISRRHAALWKGEDAIVLTASGVNTPAA